MADRYVPTRTLQQAVRRRETEVLKALGIPWQNGAPHIRCPYPDHSDEDPSWRWIERRAKACCTCTEGAHSIFDVVMHVEALDFEAAKLRIAEILKLDALIRSKDERHQAMDAAGLLRPRADQRDEQLARGYLAHRLGVARDQVPLPSTPVVGWRSLAYYDPPAKKNDRPTLVGHFPCTVFGTVAPDGRQHAHRIYTAGQGVGKAELPTGPDGRQRDPKKSARLTKGQSASGCVAVWGDPARARHLLLAEGIETSGALALAHRAEVEAGELAVAAALSTSGIRAFVPWPATRRITIAADRDEDRPSDDRGFKAGEKAACSFARTHQEHLKVLIALPGDPGEDVDWLDVLRSAGTEAVRVGIAGAQRFEPPTTNRASDNSEAGAGASEDEGEAVLREIVDRAKVDPSAPFERETLSALVAVRQDNPPAYQRAIRQLKHAGVRLRDLEGELRRASFRVIQGGPSTAATNPVVEAGSYFVTRDGMIAWRKETRDGSVAVPLCNFTARIVAEEVIDDGAERRTILAIEGAMPDGRRLACARVLAERYSAMNWVTEAWGTAPVILAGQGRKDQLRAAIQMLSGAVASRTVYGHLGWRRIGDHWAFLHSGGAICADGALDCIEVDTGTDGFLAYELPAVPAASEIADAVRASLALLDLGPDTITGPVLGAVYRAPLSEPSPVDFALHLAGPTGAFKTELAALAQAHFGPAFNGRRLPASWADTANMLEKKAFLAKDTVLVVDDFAPAGTTADTQRLHRDADRLFRAAGNRSGRARMRADGGSRPTYYPRGLIISTGEDVPSGQSLRARLLVLELTPGEIPIDRLSAAQAAAAEGMLAAAMAGYLRWLAPQIDRLEQTQPERQRALRDTLVQANQHRRTPDVAASLILGWETFLRFAAEAGAIGRDDAAHTLTRVRIALTDSADMQGAHLASEEPAQRFLALLRAALSSHRAHVADATSGAEPEDAACWGWQLNVIGSGAYEREEWRPNGECLGWIRNDGLLLDPDTAFATAQKLAREQGTSIPIKQRTLWKRLDEQGLLASRDQARGSTVRLTIQGMRRDLLHLRASTLAAETGQSDNVTGQRDETGQEEGPESRGLPGSGQFGQFGQKMKHRGPEERALRDAVGWEVEI
jgi:Toprim domain